MSKTYRPYAPHQAFLLPPSPQEWLPEDHLAYFVLDVVGELDLGAIRTVYEREERGYPPYDPRMMVTLLLYAYCVGVPSSRRIERRTYEDVAFRVLSGGQHPDHTRISEFRRRHLGALAGLFTQVLRLCRKAGLVKLGHVALDGTKVKANASKHKAMSYERMKAREAELAKRVDELLASAEAADRAEESDTAAPLPEDLRHARSRLERIRKAKAELEAEAQEQAQQRDAARGAEGTAEGSDDDDPEPPTDGGAATTLPHHQVAAYADGTPKPKAQRNFTDADSRIQKTGDGFVQGYNCQAAVDAHAQVIVAQAVSNQGPDTQYFAPMLTQVVANCGSTPRAFSADAGYFSERNVAVATAAGVDAYIATGRQKHGERAVAPRGRIPAGLSIKQRMARKLATQRGAREYRQRKCVVEPVFGQVKQARGMRQFLLRGIEKVRGEWALICLTHNLLKLSRATVAA